MCKIKYVHRRKNSGKFQFRQNVPADLQEVLGKKVIKRSLDTMDTRLAGERLRLFLRLRVRPRMEIMDDVRELSVGWRPRPSPPLAGATSSAARPRRR